MTVAGSASSDVRGQVEPPKQLRFRRRVRIRDSIAELWRSRELVVTLAERDLRVRYKQTLLGAGWAILTPLALMLVFTIFLQRVARFDTGGVPYALFSYIGLLPWTFFSTSIAVGGQSLVMNSSLLNKIYCPREAFPVASVAVALFDMAFATIVLGLLFVITEHAPRPTSAWVAVLLPIQLSVTLGATLITASVLVYLRDLRHLIPVVLQLGLFVTPVAYGIEVIPNSIRQLYVTINPLAAVIDGYRRAVLWGLPPHADVLVPAAMSSAAILFVGYATFKRLETGFADVA